MKVLHIFNSIMPSGAETMWTAAASILNARDVETHVVATGDTLGPYAETMREVGFIVHHVPHRRKSLFDFGYCRALYGLIKQNGYEAVQVHPEAWRLTNVVEARVAGVKSITTTVHSIFAFGGFRFWRRVAILRLCKILGAKIIAIGDSVLQNEKRYHYMPSLIYNWVDVGRYMPLGLRDEVRQELAVAKGKKVLMVVGNCSEIKNHSFFIRVLSMLPPDFIAIHVGREDESVYHERALALQLGVAGRIVFLGARNDVFRLLEAADVFVMTSLLEGIPLSCLEALVKGLPAVVADAPGLRDLAKHIPLCEKTVADDARVFADKICEVSAWTEDELLRRKEASQKVMKEKFDIKNGVNAYIDIWKGSC